MTRKSVSRGVIFYKRLIAAVIALLILILAALAVHYAAEARRLRAELEQLRGAPEALAPAGPQSQPQPVPGGGAPEPSPSPAPAPSPAPGGASGQTKPAGEQSAMEIISANKLAAKAFGAMDGVKGLDCLEGFEASYGAGIRVFETDLRLTSDGRVVLRRDWKDEYQEAIGPDAIPTLEAFLSTPLLGKYTPLSFQDLLQLMTRCPDVCVIIDTPDDVEGVGALFGEMVAEARELGLDYLFDRMAVQVYSAEHYAAVDAVYHFPCCLYMLYYEGFDQKRSTFEEKAAFCEAHGIPGIVMWADWWDSNFEPVARAHNVTVLAHNVNTVRAAGWLLDSGIQCIYSDTLRPADLEG